jgi:hypothetical protein
MFLLDQYIIQKQVIIKEVFHLDFIIKKGTFFGSQSTKVL